MREGAGLIDCWATRACIYSLSVFSSCHSDPMLVHIFRCLHYIFSLLAALSSAFHPYVPALAQIDCLWGRFFATGCMRSFARVVDISSAWQRWAKQYPAHVDQQPDLPEV